ncbi:MAG: hypothetical protein C4518_06480 [Desulfobacteraceae bacterium]|nr:MAG: hypothetical protein C4518_06480 [Desulfobacteraceae bacterium]
MTEEKPRKPRSKTKTIFIAIVSVFCLALLAGWVSGPPAGQKAQFLSEIHQNAVADCNDDPECLENIRLHFDECLRGNYASERSGIFTTTYNLDAEGLYDCLNDFSQTE